MTLPIIPPLANCVDEVYFFQLLPWDEYIALVIPWIRGSPLIQYDNCVLHVPVHKIRPEFGATAGPPWSSIDRTVN